MSSVAPAEALAQLWRLGGGDPSALDCVHLTGMEPVLPSSFAVGTAAQVSIAAAALAAREIRRESSGDTQLVHVDMRHAAIEFRSERYMRSDTEPPPAWDKIAGLYRSGDGGWVRLHTNFPHHRDGMLALLGASYDREAVQNALTRWRAEDLETEASRRGLVATALRTPGQWAAHPQGQAIAGLELLDFTRLADAAPRALPKGDRPLSGLRVLDLTRVIAGPVAGRTLAAHGADVLYVASPNLPSIGVLVMDANRGKLSTWIDLETAAGKATLEALLAEADILIQGYRPGGLARLGFSPERCSALSPGLIHVSLSAYGHAGPWSERRGFDSLVQTATGINHAEAAAAGAGVPRELPCQALDHASGQLMAFAAMMAVLKRARQGGSWHVRVSLAQTGHWLTSLGQVENGFAAPDPTIAQIGDLLEECDSGFGRMSAVRHAGRLQSTPPHYLRPSVPLGSHRPEWPPR